MLNKINSLESSNISHFANPAAFTEMRSAAASSSQRASLRRMRTETMAPRAPLQNTVSMDENIDRIQKLATQIDTSIREGKYSDALSTLRELERLVNGTFRDDAIAVIEQNFFIDSSDIRSAIEHLNNGVFSEARAYLLALNNDRSAIELCNSGFDNLKLGIQEIKDILNQIGMPILPAEEMAEGEKLFESIHFTMRGMINMALNSREAAIEDLRAGFKLAMELEGDSTADFAFFAKTLEQKLQARLLPESMIVDEKDPRSLLMAGRYEEALQLLSTPQFEDKDGAQAIRGACLALLGRFDEALDQFESSEYGYYNHSEIEQSLGCTLVHYLKGDHAKAKELALDSGNDNPVFGYLLLLALNSN